VNRHLDWDGCHNVRDLGGLRTRDGRVTRRGAVVRADAVDRLSVAGWASLVAHGVHTVIDLRNEDERDVDVAARPESVTTLVVPLDGTADAAFWAEWGSGPQIGTPLYYGPFLDCFPERVVEVVGTVARAEPGGVVVHCRVGRDRAGLVSLMLLALAGVSHDAIVSDYELSAGRVPDDENGITEELARRGTTARAAILELLATLDPEAYLRAAGLSETDVATLRARLL
jgi:protein tyrosine/serine phosphatase